MNDLLRAIAAEATKLRRTAALPLAVAVPSLVIFVFLLIGWHNSNLAGRLEAWPWLLKSVTGLWTLLVLPFLAAIVATTVARIDHQANAWKHLFALPTSRQSILGAKLAAGIGLIGVAHLVLGMGMALVGLVLDRFTAWSFPPVPVVFLVHMVGAMFLASTCMITIHAAVALRWPGLSTLSALIAVGLSLALSMAGQDVWPYFPWSLPGHAARTAIDSATTNATTVPWVVAGLIGSVVVAVPAGWLLGRRDIL